LISLICGGGTNTAVSFSRLGFKTAFLGKIGADENGKKVFDLLENEHITFVGAKGEQTGYSIVLDSFEEDRTILTFKGGNNKLEEKDFSLNSLQTKWLYSSSMVGASFETLKIVMKQLKKQGCHIAFNPSNYQAKRGLAFLQEIIDLCEVIILNLEEARLLLQNPHGQIEELARLLAQNKPRYVIITNGKEGALCYYKQASYTITPSSNIKVIETTGAGDAFGSGFIAGLMQHFSIEDSLMLGMVQAESVIQAKGAKQNLLYKEDARKRMKLFTGTITTNRTTGVEQHPQFISQAYMAKRNKTFHLANSRQLHSLEELAFYLPLMPDSVFSHHVTETENHFSLWIQDVFHLSSLAKKIQLIKDKHEMSIIINSFLREINH